MKNVLLFGSGYMAEQYLKVLQALGCSIKVVGRNEAKARTLASRYGAQGFGGGTEALKTIDTSTVDLAIIATAAESLKAVTLACINQGIHSILAEKPGAVNASELLEIKSGLAPDTWYRIAYNRRFYNSVVTLKKRILAEGAMGCSFEFTELEKNILTWDKPRHLLARLGFLNSSHVIDTAFNLIGSPVDLVALRDGSIEGHPSGNVFSGCGRTKVCLFSYLATWGGGGRWGIDLATKNGKYRLCPLEELWFCKKDAFTWEKIESEDADDQKYKPGLYKMVSHVLQGDKPSQLPGIDDQITMCRIIDKIFYYEN